MEKSKFQTAKEKAAKLLKFFTEKEEAFEAVKVKDADTLIEYSELVKGADVSISTGSSSEVAPDGDYKLVNGAEITVKDGKIDAITKEADEAPAEEEAKENLADEETAAEEPKEAEKSEDLKALETKVAKLEEVVASIMQVVDELPSKDDVSEFNNNVKELSKVPTQLSVDNRVEFQDSEGDKIKRVASLFYKK